MTDILASYPETIPEAIRRAAVDFKDKGIGVFDSRGRNAERRTYAEFWAAVRDRASRIASLGVERNEPVIVALPTSWDWLEAWFGVLLAGGWPVAASGTGAIAAAEAQFGKIDAVMGKLGSRYVISSAGFREQGVNHGHEWARTGVITLDDIAALSCVSGFKPARRQADETAFLQLTSGSTGLPRAVMISHRGALHNAVASSIAMGVPKGRAIHEWTDAMVSWLPLYHDMGLIGCLMLPLITGIDTWFLRPQTFLARPKIWLEMLGNRGSTFAPSPNFGYQLCVERIKPHQLEGLDLSSWWGAMTGAEMIRKETTTAFSEKFSPCGFEPTSFMPCYGLAEATLAVTFDVRGEGVRTLPAPAETDIGFQLSDVVSNGSPIDATEVVIRAPDGRHLEEDRIGEVCISGPGIFQGYYRDEEATAASLRDGWFATGDLGFLNDGELYLTGRTKEVLIVHGHNIMPEELERIADGVTGGGGLIRSAAFSVAKRADGEQAVLVVEVADPAAETLPDAEQAIRSKIGRQLGLPLADLVFVRRGKIPRTSSGKLQRREVRRRYLEGRLHDDT